MFRFPFHHKWKWYAKNRYTHLIVGIQNHLDRFSEPYSTRLHERAQAMKKWTTLRVVLLVLLSTSLLAAASAAIASAIPRLADVSETLDTAFSIVGAFSGLFTLAFFFANRTLGQLEADIIVCLALGAKEPE